MTGTILSTTEIYHIFCIIKNFRDTHKISSSGFKNLGIYISGFTMIIKIPEITGIYDFKHF